MNTHDQLKLGAPREVGDRLEHPVHHALEGVRRIVDLRIPDDVRQQSDARLREIEPELARDDVDVLDRTIMKADPIAGAVPPTLEVVEQRTFQRRTQVEVFP